MREILQQTWLFNELSEPESRDLLKETQILKLPQGARITEKGKKNDVLRIVIDGEVGVLPEPSPTAAPGDLWSAEPVARLGGGEMFGEMSWLDGQAASATLVASTPLTVLALPHAGFDRFLARNPEVHIQVLRKLAVNLSHRLRSR